MALHQLIQRLKQSDQTAAEHTEALLALESPTPETVYPHVRGYVLAKFLLDETATDSDSFQELASLSMAQSLKISEGDLAVTDLSDRCAAAPSAETKIVLVMMRLETALHIKLDVMDRVDSETISDLSRSICRKLLETYM